MKTVEHVLRFRIPVKPVSEPNRRDHWAAKRRRVKSQKALAYVAAKEALRGHAVELPLRITLTRIGPAMDDDNNAASLKATQDGIAAALGIDDGLIQWNYIQDRPRSPGVEVEIA